MAGKAYLATVETAWRRRSEYYAVPWRGRWATERGGTLLSHAIHTHDMLCYVLGPPSRVFALRNGTELPVTLAAARQANELITAMYYSAETGQSVTLPIGADHPRYASWIPC